MHYNFVDGFHIQPLQGCYVVATFLPVGSDPRLFTFKPFRLGRTQIRHIGIGELPNPEGVKYE